MEKSVSSATFLALPTFLDPAISMISTVIEADITLPQHLKTIYIKEARELLFQLVNRTDLDSLQDRISIEVTRSGAGMHLEVINRGTPINFQRASGNGGNLYWKMKNMGRGGQSLSLHLDAQKLLSVPPTQPRYKNLKSLSDIQFQKLRPGSESELTDLFYRVYGYQYINEDVYFPERLAQMIQDGDLESIVALDPDGNLVGHVGLLKKSQHPLVYEAAMGIVDPKCPVRGVFRDLFADVMKRSLEIPMHYCFFDFVTNHELSQRSVNKYGTVDLAILIGCQRKETQARLAHLGLGEDPEEMDRYSLLCGLISRVKNPFGTRVSVPVAGGELLQAVLQPLGLEWAPRSRFDFLKPHGEFGFTLNEAQNAAYFDLMDPGQMAVAEIIEEWKGLLKQGYLYASVTTPLDFSGLGQVYDQLANAGFFLAGFMPYRFSDRLALVMQSSGPARVDWENIRVVSQGAKELLELVKQDYQRNHIL